MCKFMFLFPMTIDVDKPDGHHMMSSIRQHPRLRLKPLNHRSPESCRRMDRKRNAAKSKTNYTTQRLNKWFITVVESKPIENFPSFSDIQNFSCLHACPS